MADTAETMRLTVGEKSSFAGVPISRTVATTMLGVLTRLPVDALVTAAGTLSDLLLDEAHNAEIARGTSTPGQRLGEAGLDAVIRTVADKLGEMRSWLAQLSELGPSAREACRD